MQSIKEAKKSLRQQVRDRPPIDYTPLVQSFLKLPQVVQAKTLMLFLGVGREPDTKPLIEVLLSMGKQVVLPCCLPERKMEGRAITHLNQLELGCHNIPAPSLACPVVEKKDIDLILVPHICCDVQGFRLGQGGGYYDRFLEDYHGMTVALCPPELLQERVPRELFDRPVQLVLTQ